MTSKNSADRSSVTRLLFAAAVLLLAEPALAFRCKGKLVMEGDPKAKVLRFCGEPVSVQQRTIYRGGIPRQDFDRRISLGAGDTEVGESQQELLIHNRSIVEVIVEEWTYNFGPHRLMRVVRFENGLVAEVTRLGYGYLE